MPVKAEDQVPRPTKTVFTQIEPLPTKIVFTQTPSTEQQIDKWKKAYVMLQDKIL